MRRLHTTALRTRPFRLEGFTFFEVVAVIVILGLIFSFAVPNLDGLTPKYRLRTAARELGRKIEEHRIRSITKATWLGIRYVIDEETTYYELLKPPPIDFPNQPVSDRASYPREELPEGVRIESVVVRGSTETVDNGEVVVLFAPTGMSGSHMVTMVNNREMRWTMTLNAITGMIEYDNAEDAGFDDFEG
ncbi:MAG: hypothetical protein AAF488_17840 [Planctomycetota bacterium]